MHLLFFEYDKAPALSGAGALSYLQADPNAGAFDRLFRNRNDKYTSPPAAIYVMTHISPIYNHNRHASVYQKKRATICTIN